MDNESAKNANEHSQIGNATTTNGVQHPSHIENRTNILDLQATSGLMDNSAIIPVPFANGTSTNGNGFHTAS